MSPLLRHVNLIRYLIVWKVNGSLIQRPRCLSSEISRTLGAAIARRLPTREAGDWHRMAAAWEGASPTIPEPGWPIPSVIFAYPGKRVQGQGEVILWELKLLGDSADHGLFLELILPAMEETATTARPPSSNLWGRFDIQAVYAACGQHWQPIVLDGRLDLGCQVSPSQWREGLTLGRDEQRAVRKLVWLTPFDLGRMSDAPPDTEPPGKPPAAQVPTLQGILNALVIRLTRFLPGKRPQPEEVWKLIEAGEDPDPRLALQEQGAKLSPRSELEEAPKGWPGRWIGQQTFPSIPSAVLPYLELASIVHIGQYTHYGCGTFRLE